ncbi:MAG: 3-oxoacyl-[acyl-carrier protein] reductase [Kiritimatiellia bacterium]|jgi:3-oxoacyl-[acyl-carrier protein] reductase
MNISDLNVLVTGGGSGMGRAFTLAFARDGANVAFCDVNADAIAAVQAEGLDLPGKVVGFLADVSNEQLVIELINKADSALGGLNGLINNAGIFRDGLLVKKDRETGEIRKMSLRQWQQVIDIDLTGPFLCTREFAANAVDKGINPAVVVNISSIARHGNRGQTNYSAAKAGLVADTKVWSVELAKHGIRFGAVAPGFVKTPILEGMRPEVLQGMLKAVPLRRAAEPEEIYMAVKFIVECGYFTGRCIDVDGGMVV